MKLRFMVFFTAEDGTWTHTTTEGTGIWILRVCHSATSANSCYKIILPNLNLVNCLTLLYNIVFIQSTKILKVININLQNTKSVWVCPADASDEPQSIHYEETETISDCFQKANFRLWKSFKHCKQDFIRLWCE